MIRYRYGPWDPSYYAVLGSLIGHGLRGHPSRFPTRCWIPHLGYGRELAAGLQEEYG